MATSRRRAHGFASIVRAACLSFALALLSSRALANTPPGQGAPPHDQAQHAHTHGDIRGAQDVGYDRGLVRVDTVLGMGSVTDEASGRTERSSLVSFVVSPRVHATRSVALTLGMPFTTRGGVEAASALGNLRLVFAHEIELHEDLVIPLELALTAPTAQGDLFGNSSKGVKRAEANAAAAAARGFEEDELFATHHLGIVPTVNVEYDHHDFDLAAYTELPFLFHEGGTAPSRPGVSENKLAIESVTVVELLGQLAGEHNCDGCLHVLLGPRAWLAYFVKEELELAGSHPSKAQAVVEPTLRVMWKGLRGRAGYIQPVGGRLHHAESTVAGLRLSLGSVF